MGLAAGLISNLMCLNLPYQNVDIEISITPALTSIVLFNITPHSLVLLIV